MSSAANRQRQLLLPPTPAPCSRHRDDVDALAAVGELRPRRLAVAVKLMPLRFLEWRVDCRIVDEAQARLHWDNLDARLTTRLPNVSQATL